VRVVLDTNTIISALLFSGTASRLVPIWRSGRIQPLLSRPILDEYLRALAYPKFGLGADEIKELLGETFLPFAEVVRVTKRLAIRVRDPDDRKFLECAVAGRAEFLVAGDRDLLALQSYRGLAILTAGDFLTRIEA
jgi:putative PIN family toxin of toxin-antitoxin system